MICCKAKVLSNYSEPMPSLDLPGGVRGAFGLSPFPPDGDGDEEELPVLLASADLSLLSDMSSISRICSFL